MVITAEARPWVSSKGVGGWNSEAVGWVRISPGVTADVLTRTSSETDSCKSAPRTKHRSDGKLINKRCSSQ